MRLLNTTKRKLEEFGGDKIPRYAILSHTWGESEITFQDIERDDAEKRVAYEKIRKTCDMAAAHGFNYVWIDTCCIDKTSSAELSEAINSMFRWYQDSEICYAYLADVLPDAADHQPGTIGPDFSKSRWFARGWTLQELIAPSAMIFLNQKWQELGTKSTLQNTISEITGIPTNILLGGDLEDASVAQRMSWASRRKTTRVEDVAYCLMGIFGINMPMLYGEGQRAFMRLQEEIMKVSDDHSLFAWNSSENHGSLLATSPAAFFNSNKIVPLNPSGTSSGAITVNNKGVHLKLYFRFLFQDIGLAILPCVQNGKKIAICLKPISETNEYFGRILGDRLELLDIKYFSQLEYLEKSICVQQERRIHKNWSSLPRAITKGDEVLVKLLLEKGAGVETSNTDYDHANPLLWAVKNGLEEIVKLLLEKGAKLEYTLHANGMAPLLWAAHIGHVGILKLLLEKGARSEVADCDRWTTLYFAAMNGYEAIVKLLLEKGVKPDVKESFSSKIPLIIATMNGHEAIVKLLLENEANVEVKDCYGRMALLEAAENGDEAIVKLLLENGANVNVKDRYDRMALLKAAMNGDEAIVKLLLENGANVEVKDCYGRMVLLEAAENGHEAIVKLLLENGANVNVKDCHGQTPLSKAAKNGHEAVVKLLLENGAKVNIKDRDGLTALSWAAAKEHDAVVNLLLKNGAKRSDMSAIRRFFGW